MRWNVAEIKYQFKGKLMGDDDTKNMVAQTLLKFPSEIIEYITKNCWILSSADDAWAYTFKGEDIKNGHLIFLSDELLEQSIPQIQFTLAHEIGHVILGHRNSINYKQTKKEINQQEFEADRFANQYLLQ